MGWIEWAEESEVDARCTVIRERETSQSLRNLKLCGENPDNADSTFLFGDIDSLLRTCHRLTV
jgi:hypothetical protein